MKPASSESPTSLTRYVRAWWRRQFADPQAVILALMLIVVTALVVLFGRMLAPVFAAVVLAYLLEGVVTKLVERGAPRLTAVLVVFLTFFAGFLALTFIFLPLVSRQVAQLLQEVPVIIAQGQEHLLQLPERYPQLFNEGQVLQLLGEVRAEAAQLGQRAFALSLSLLPNLVAMTVYLVLVPLLVFFFMKDKQTILSWLRNYLPRQRDLAQTVWHDVDRQIGNYVRGKAWEILIVAVLTYVTFMVIGINYALLLATLVGLSVLIPYIGATVMTFPVMLVAFSQWGFSSTWLVALGVYLVIQAVDANVLVPLIFSEAVNLHPVAIIVAILVFGGLWGFWGIFFAIPLATVVKAVLTAWPRPARNEPAPPEEASA